MLNYIDLKYKPSLDDVIVEYFVEPNKISVSEAAEQIAAESSIGTWTSIVTMSPKIAKKLKPTVFSIKGSYIKIAYPPELFEYDNIPQILSAVAGNVFGMKLLKNLRLEDISLPKKIVDKYKGPAFGIQGVRKIVGVKNRPLVGTIVKPKVGLSAKEHAQVAKHAWVGGCDVVKDDENLTDQSFNRFEDRVIHTIDARNKAEDMTGEKKVYMPNITAETQEMIKRAEFVKKSGGRYIMIDILTAGWSAVQTIRNLNLGLVIHAHRAMHAALTRNPKHGISMLTISKLSRLVGVDQLHIGTVVGKMEGSSAEVMGCEIEIEERIVQPNKNIHCLEQRWYNLKPTFAVCSGGLHPGMVPDLIKMMGKNIIIQMGGGIHGHPLGTLKGAQAARQAVDAVLKKKSLKKYAISHSELKKALEKWS
ncbi:type III ribulose-bisphosphate carboxylase [Candidatus Woesearchaeota archaeon B3_Woes]|nr:MAG: type III ribulose-bisphosphate carboxylase [Candidatus Woesearchaeota archaeon B3_Woes]